MGDKFTMRDGMVFGLARNGSGTDYKALLHLLNTDESFLCTMLNLAHCEGEQDGMEQARKTIFGDPAKSESEEALEGAVSKMLDSGDLDRAVPMASDILRAKRAGYDIGPDDIGEPSEDEDQLANEQAAQVDRTLAATVRRMGGGQ